MVQTDPELTSEVQLRGLDSQRLGTVIEPMDSPVPLAKSTEQTAIQIALQEKEAQVVALLDATMEGILGTDENGLVTFANAASARELRYESAEDILGIDIDLLLASDHRTIDSADQANLIDKIRRGESVHADDARFRRRDQTLVPVEFWAHPILRHEKANGAVVTFINVTERKELQRIQLKMNQELELQLVQRGNELAKVRNRLGAALTGANVGLWDWDVRSNRVYYSATYKSLLGYPADVKWDSLKVWKSQLHPDDRDVAILRVKRYLEHLADEYRQSFRLRCQDGSYRWMLAQGRAEFDSDGIPQRMIGVLIDVTQQKSYEQQLKELNLQLENSNEALHESNVELQQFAYVASHDLQTPLRAIAGFAELLDDEFRGQLDEIGTEYIHRIVAATKRMQQLINDLLAYSRVESRATTFESTSLNVAFDEAKEMLHATIEKKAAIVTRDDLPTIVGDPSQLMQLMQNLVGNGIMYCDDSSPRIHVSAARDDDQWLIAISDNGIGIDEEHRERIFEIFRRLHTHQQYPGTGIGLAICRRIVTHHGGKIWVESNPQSGSTFNIMFPSES